MTQIAPGIVELPNLFTLEGHGVSVTIALDSIDGRPRVNYQNSHQAQSFAGDQVTVEETALGKAVTVTIVKTVDAGNTTFTVLLPFINIALGQHSISTLGITAMHRTSLVGIGHGQATTYHSTRLTGSATQVESISAG